MAALQREGSAFNKEEFFVLVAPSMLASDFSRLGEELDSIKRAGADWVHLDIMDGEFVPNISMGIPVIASIRRCTDLPFDVHLMIRHPMKYIPQFREAGADIISFHLEADDPVDDTIRMIAESGAKPALAIRPGTPAQAVLPYLDRLYMVLVMTVEPGFGGQSFMADMLPKVKEIKQAAPGVLVQVDGGIKASNAGLCAAAGVDICVAGTSVFRADDRAAAIRAIAIPE